MTDPSPGPGSSGVTPIVVPASPVPDQTATAVRDLVKLAGAALVTHGIVSQADVAAYSQVVVGAILIIWPVVWSQLRTRLNWSQKQTMAQALPDTVAVAQKEPTS